MYSSSSWPLANQDTNGLSAPNVQQRSTRGRDGRHQRQLGDLGRDGIDTNSIDNTERNKKTGALDDLEQRWASVRVTAQRVATQLGLD